MYVCAYTKYVCVYIIYMVPPRLVHPLSPGPDSDLSTDSTVCYIMAHLLPRSTFSLYTTESTTDKHSNRRVTAQSAPPLLISGTVRLRSFGHPDDVKWWTFEDEKRREVGFDSYGCSHLWCRRRRQSSDPFYAAARSVSASRMQSIAYRAFQLLALRVFILSVCGDYSRACVRSKIELWKEKDQSGGEQGFGVIISWNLLGRVWVIDACPVIRISSNLTSLSTCPPTKTIDF